MRFIFLLLVMMFGCFSLEANIKNTDPFDGATVFYYEVVDYQIEGDSTPHDFDENLLNFDCSEYDFDDEYKKDSYYARLDTLNATPSEKINNWINDEKIDGVILSKTTVTCFGVQK